MILNIVKLCGTIYDVKNKEIFKEMGILDA